MWKTTALLILLLTVAVQAQDNWEQKYPAASPSSRQGHAMAYIGEDKVLLFGGYTQNLIGDTWIYDLSDNTWTQVYPLQAPSARILHSMTYIGDDKVLLFGGQVDLNNDTYSSQTWIYDLSENSWTNVVPSSAPSPRGGSGLAHAAGDQAVLYGGVDTNSYFSTETWLYDRSEGSWTLKSPISNPSFQNAPTTMVSLGGGQVLLYGHNEAMDQSATWQYNVNNDEWTLKQESAIPAPRTSHAMAEVQGSDWVLLFGGFSLLDNNPTGTLIYDLSDNAWSTQSPVTSPGDRFNHAMASIGVGKVLMVGESSPAGPTLETWCYSATLPATTYIISATAESNHGSISPQGMLVVNSGADQTFTFSPAPGYQVAAVTVDGNPVANPTSSYTFTNVTSNHTIFVAFSPIPVATYTILATSGSGGTISPSGTVVVSAGTDLSFVFTANAGYELSSVTVDGNPVTNPAASFTFTNVTSNHTIDVQYALLPGSVEGTVSSGSSGFAGVTVKLLDDGGNPIAGINPLATGSSGQYAFNAVPPANYQVMVVEPFGYVADLSPKVATVLPGSTTTINFTLTPTAAANNALGKGYWKHQFDVHVYSQGQAQESAAQLTNYISAVQTRYTLHFGLFAGMSTFAQWQSSLTVNGNQPMFIKAKSQLAAFLMNFFSLKIVPSTVVTADGRTASDVLSYVSTLLSDNIVSNDALAKSLAESVNQQELIGAGIVPAGTVVYKRGAGNGREAAVLPEALTLSQNYPNPFNPSTTISYAIPMDAAVQLRVYDALGREVAVLVNELQPAGSYSVQFDASRLAGGSYYYMLEAGGQSLIRGLTLLK